MIKKFPELNRLLLQRSTAVVPNIYSTERIERWNQLIDPTLSTQKSARKYVSALDLLNLDLLNEIFSKELQTIIFDLIPDAELYHCHIYEISPNQTQPHIKPNNNLSGWHRDSDCKHDFTQNNLQHISIFIYLSDVKNNGGYFEVSDKKLSVIPSIKNSDECYQLIGDKGLSFLFDRKSFHRASPNFSDNPRRVLKISIQSRKLFNHKKDETIFRLVREKLASNQAELKQLFGDRLIQSPKCKTITDSFIQEFDRHCELPVNHSRATFTIKENFTRYTRDLRFIITRLLVKYLKLNDQKVPSPKITYQEDKN